MSFKTGLVYTLDCGEFGENLERALAMMDYAAFERRREEARGRGRLRGIGFANIRTDLAGAGRDGNGAA